MGNVFEKVFAAGEHRPLDYLVTVPDNFELFNEQANDSAIMPPYKFLS